MFGTDQVAASESRDESPVSDAGGADTAGLHPPVFPLRCLHAHLRLAAYVGLPLAAASAAAAAAASWTSAAGAAAATAAAATAAAAAAAAAAALLALFTAVGGCSSAG